MVTVYLVSRRILEKLFLFLEASFSGFWLGVMQKDALHAVDKAYYDRQKMYHLETYNRRGLWRWEQECLKAYFQKCRTILMIGVGGGREVLALRQLGFDVDGFECHPDLVDSANELLEKSGYPPTIRIAQRDECPITHKRYDGVIVGWGAYMLIQGRVQRIALLKQLRAHLHENSPILLSFFSRSGNGRQYRITAMVSNFIRRILGRECLEIGDNLVPNFVHFFTKEEITSELQESGFGLALYATSDYGHAVGLVAPACTTSFTV